MALNSSHITCVCTANICRSPMAERLLAHALKAEEGPLRSIPVISAGVSSYEGNNASNNSVLAMKKVGLDLSGHCSQSVSQEIVDGSWVIFCMTDSHKYLLHKFFPNIKAPVVLFRQFLDSSAETQVTDPYGMNLDVYENCRDNLVEALPSCINYLKTEIFPLLKKKSDS